MLSKLLLWLSLIYEKICMFSMLQSLIRRDNMSNQLADMMSYLSAFHTVHGILKARTLKWVAIPVSSGQSFSSGKNTWVGNHSLLQGIFLTQGSNQNLPHFREILYCLSHQESPKCSTWVQSQNWQNDLGLFSRHTIHYHSNANLFPSH